MSDNQFTSVPDPLPEVNSLAEVARALKRTMEVLVSKSSEWDAKILALQNTTGTAPTGSGTGTGSAFGTTTSSDTKSKYNFDDPTYDAVFEAANQTAKGEIALLRADIINTYAQVKTGITELQQDATTSRSLADESLIRLAKDLGGAIGNLQTKSGSIQSATESLSGNISGVFVETAKNKAAIVTEQVARTTADTALAAQITTLTSSVGNNTAAITQEATTRATADTAISNTLSSLTSTVNSNTAAISSEATTRANADNAITATVMSLTSTVNANTSAITTEASTRANADTALSGQITSLTSSVNSNTAAITSEAATRASADSSLSSRIDTVSASTGAGTANGFYRLTAVSNPTDGAAAEFATEVKASANGTFSSAGMRIQAFSNGTNRIKFNADQFLVQSSTNTNYTPFAIVSGQLISNAITSAGNVSGLGSLATQNSVSAGNVSGLGSLATQNSVSSGQVSGLGSMALINKITSLNIATYMDNAVISNAYIGNAEVSTLKIAGNAVTQAQSVYVGPQTELAQGSWTELGAVWISLSGSQPLLVWASLGVPASHIARAGESQDLYYEGNWWKINAFTSDMLFRFCIKYNAYSTYSDSGIIGHFNTGVGVTYSVALSYTFPNPPAGYYRVSVEGQTVSGYEIAGARTVSLSCLETKR